MLPHVIMHNSISLDGRNVGFEIDMGLHYEIAAKFEADVHLTGSNTILSSEEEIPKETEEDLKPPKIDPNDERSLLVIPDSRGRLRNWHALRKTGYWRDVVALCSKSTPKEYLDYLKKRYIDYLVAGDDHVDMKTALEELNSRYGVKRIHLDSGGTLNGVMLRAGLVNEVSVLVHPSMVGGMTLHSIFQAPDLTSFEGVIQLKLKNFEKVKNDMVWLHYEVVGKEVS